MTTPDEKLVQVATLVRPEIDLKIRIKAAEQGFKTKSAWFQSLIDKALQSPTSEEAPHVR